MGIIVVYDEEVDIVKEDEMVRLNRSINGVVFVGIDNEKCMT